MSSPAGPNLPSDGAVPGVQLGIVLAFPCPRCGGWCRPVEACGFCYDMRCCGSHLTGGRLVHQGLIQRLADAVHRPALS